jgi:hypothetical protein
MHVPEVVLILLFIDLIGIDLDRPSASLIQVNLRVLLELLS